ncbi:DUF302 domain-containing protein [Acidiphilium sp. JA12-A1]|uniref:DUF302 domain-containing protein n=1 Tax=Acidiphilium sp. JA12-A1 TaxID=1464546 RepID=UPI00046110F7|nr:DUF302 domain-containing protein [Acidiphilium sp. JA12-A1]KDM66080.1 hypothetical protein ACIDI_71c00200 [Acidiphilium sp. JA12-A1]
MTAEVVTNTTIPVRHVKIELPQTFEHARATFESILPKFDGRISNLLREGEFEGAREKLESGPELAIFQSRDHGNVLKVAGLARKALQYDVGNPLTASRMTRHQLAAALYAPFRVVLYENENSHAVFEYDKPSSLFGQFGDKEVLAVAQTLDAAIERTLQQVSKASLNK